MENNNIAVPTYSKRRKQRYGVTSILCPENSQTFQETLVAPELFVHAYILAMSGAGKTEIMKLLAIRFYLAQNNNIIIIDSSGDFSRQIAKMIPRKEDIVLCDLTLKKKLTPTLNPFRLKKCDSKTIAIMAQEILNALESIIGSDFSPNMEALLTPCIYTLLQKGDSGLDELLVFMNDKLNTNLVELGLKSPIKVHREFFQNQFMEKKFQITKDAIATRLQLLLNNPIFYNFITGNSTINLEKLMTTKGKIILFRLPKSEMRKTLEPAAKLLMATIQGIALKRANIPEELRTKTYLFLDEFQNFVNPTLLEILSESRKYNLSVICAHQNLSQIDTKTRDSLLSNTHIKIIGKNANKDIKIMSSEIGVTIEELANLQNNEFYSRVDSEAPIKFIGTDKFLGDKEAISELQWKQHLKYWKKHYYKKMIDTTVVESVDDDTIDNSNASLPIPKFDIEDE